MPRLINHEDLAALAGMSRRQILEWARTNRDGFPSAVKVIGRTYLFNRQEILDYLKIREDRPSQNPPSDVPTRLSQGEHTASSD